VDASAVAATSQQAVLSNPQQHHDDNDDDDSQTSYDCRTRQCDHYNYTCSQSDRDSVHHLLAVHFQRSTIYSTNRSPFHLAPIFCQLDYSAAAVTMETRQALLP
jgi:hypothetical protein